MPPQEANSHGSFGMQTSIESFPSAKKDDSHNEAFPFKHDPFEDDPFAFSTSFNQLSADELDFLKEVSPASSTPKPVISSTSLSERIERLRNEKETKKQLDSGSVKSTKSRLSMNVSSHGDPASVERRSVRSSKGRLETKEHSSPSSSSEKRSPTRKSRKPRSSSSKKEEQRSSSQPPLSRPEKQNDRNNTSSSTDERNSLKERLLGKGKGKEQKESKKKPSSPPVKKYRSSSEGAIKARTAKDKVEDVFDSNFETRRSSSSSPKKQNVSPEAGETASPSGRTSSIPLSSQEQDRFPREQSASSGRSPSVHEKPRGGRRSAPNHTSSRLSASTHHQPTTPTGRRRAAAAKLSASTHHHRSRTPNGRRRPDLAASSHCSPGRQAASPHARSRTPRGRRKPIPNPDNLSKTSHQAPASPKGRRSASNHDSGRLSASTHHRPRAGRRRSVACDGTGSPSSSKTTDKEFWDRLLRTSPQRKDIPEVKSPSAPFEGDRTSVQTNQAASYARASSPHTPPHAQKERHSAREPLSAPAAARRPTVGTRNKDQVGNLPTMLDDETFQNDEFFSAPSVQRSKSPKVAPNYRGSRIGATERTRRARASATRRHSIDSSMSKLINGCTSTAPGPYM
eukprot:scaffold4180_cov99-Cylindrotheca_fusiformis.AAC.9